MKGFWPIYKRELFSLFVTPLAWVLLTTFLAVQGLHFFIIVANFATGASDLAPDAGPAQAFFGQTVLLYLPLLFVCPLLTMRLFAEERRSGTIEALLTAPVTTLGVVLAKYGAALTTYLIMWAPTGLYMVLIARTGGDVDVHVVGTSYLAVAAIGAGYLAIGTMTSAFAKSQLTAAVLSSMIVIGLFMLGIGDFVFDDRLLHAVSSHVSVWGQMNDFSKGIVDLRRLVFDATVIVLPLFVTVRTVDSWRWG